MNIDQVMTELDELITNIGYSMSDSARCEFAPKSDKIKSSVHSVLEKMEREHQAQMAALLKGWKNERMKEWKNERMKESKNQRIKDNAECSIPGGIWLTHYILQLKKERNDYE